VTDDRPRSSRPLRADAPRGADVDDVPADAGTREQALEVVPGLARIAGGAYVRALTWTAETSVRTGLGIARRLPGAGIAERLAEEAGRQARRSARQLLGVEDVEERLRRLVPDRVGQTTRAFAPGSSASSTSEPVDPAEQLRRRGAGLLDRAADVALEEDAHPAYARILDELAPDEARLLRLLATKGPQASVDIRTGRPLGIGSELIASNLTILGAEAGVRYGERVPAYLNNLFRLGLVWFSHDELQDLRAYQVLEAQPEVREAMRRAGRAPRTVRRSIALTPFGEDFCRVCLPLQAPDGASLGAVGGARGGRGAA
jgi:hypothetical protein